MMTTTTKKIKKVTWKTGGARLGDKTQKDIFAFRTTEASKEVWNSYAANLGLSQTELFYKLILLVGSLDKMMKHYERDYPAMIVGKEGEWQTIMMLIKCCDNITTMNAGRVKQYDEKLLEADKVREASEVLHNHFNTQFAKTEAV